MHTRCGSTFLLKHRVPLGQLWLLCGKDEAAGGREEEEEDGHGLKCTNALVLVWPNDGCVVTFRSREAKELWLSTMLRPSPGAPETRVTRLASLWLLVTAVSFQGASGSLTARTVEALVSAEAGTKQSPVLAPSAAEEGLGHSTAEGTKTRKRFLPWPFARRRASANGDGPGQPDSGLGTPLFGQPLATLCGEQGTLPQPVQELLAILYREGPATEGIFRKGASEKARRDLREELNKGGAVDLASQPVHLLAGILKDFLRNIPCTLLSAALYDSWMLALEKPSREEKIEGLREVADQLPRANVLLLKPLLAVLHRISQNAGTSRMGASNLAIWVGPSMLSPGTDSTLPLEVQREIYDRRTQGPLSRTLQKLPAAPQPLSCSSPEGEAPEMARVPLPLHCLLWKSSSAQCPGGARSQPCPPPTAREAEGTRNTPALRTMLRLSSKSRAWRRRPWSNRLPPCLPRSQLPLHPQCPAGAPQRAAVLLPRAFP
ncbi:T-cell activation Rho GTPase-activating protein-like [Struthio camelus]|uniref:T-cell activation Rho GTPase-activating protein-like n=2 Tax=Struthio camelus TaxID=8801 RepID=UPI0036040B62